MAPVFFDTADDFRAWLAAHAHVAHELLVGFYKVGSGKPSMTWSESVDQALCYGWIDGVRRRVDDASYTIRFTPRKRDSIWSAVNIDKMTRLRTAGLMTPAGDAAFAHRTEERSRIYLHERTEPAELPPEALALFRANAAAWDYFASCPPGYRQQMLHRIVSAKRQATRDQRLATLIAACGEKRRLV